MTKRIALALAGAALVAIAGAPAASARQVPVGDPFEDHGEWCQVYQNTNTGVFQTRCGPKFTP